MRTSIHSLAIARPSPSQRGQGMRRTCPVPSHSAQRREKIMWPRLPRTCSGPAAARAGHRSEGDVSRAGTAVARSNRTRCSRRRRPLHRLVEAEAGRLLEVLPTERLRHGARRGGPGRRSRGSRRSPPGRARRSRSPRTPRRRRRTAPPPARRGRRPRASGGRTGPRRRARPRRIAPPPRGRPGSAPGGAARDSRCHARRISAGLAARSTPSAS